MEQVMKIQTPIIISGNGTARNTFQATFPSDFAAAAGNTGRAVIQGQWWQFAGCAQSQSETKHTVSPNGIYACHTKCTEGGKTATVVAMQGESCICPSAGPSDTHQGGCLAPGVMQEMRSWSVHRRHDQQNKLYVMPTRAVRNCNWRLLGVRTRAIFERSFCKPMRKLWIWPVFKHGRRNRVQVMRCWENNGEAGARCHLHKRLCGGNVQSCT